MRIARPLLLLFYLTLICVPCNSDTNPILVVEQLNLLVDGSITPSFVNITNTYSYITSVTFCLRFTDNDLDFGAWGANSALTNGTNLHLNGDELLSNNITSNACLSAMSNRLEILTDDKNPKERHFLGYLDFFNNLEPGIYIGHANTFGFVSYENMTGTVDQFVLFVKGFYDADYEFEDATESTVNNQQNDLSPLDQFLRGRAALIMITCIVALGGWIVYKWWIA